MPRKRIRYSPCRVPSKQTRRKVEIAIWFWLSAAFTFAYTGAQAISKTRPESIYPDAGNPDRWVLLFRDVLEFLFAWGWLAVPLLGLASLRIASLRRKLDRSLQDEFVIETLTRFHEIVKPAGADHTNFRITLFKYKECKWREAKGLEVGGHKSTGYLVAVARSGPFRNKSRSKWHVSLDRPSLNEGFAGLVFGTGTVHLKEQLVIYQTLVKNQGARDAYARATGVSTEWLDAKLQTSEAAELPRALWGSPVEIEGVPWGVLLVDSTMPKIGTAEFFVTESAWVLRNLNVIFRKETRK